MCTFWSTMQMVNLSWREIMICWSWLLWAHRLHQLFHHGLVHELNMRPYMHCIPLVIAAFRTPTVQWADMAWDLAVCKNGSPWPLILQKQLITEWTRIERSHSLYFIQCSCRTPQLCIMNINPQAGPKPRVRSPTTKSKLHEHPSFT